MASIDLSGMFKGESLKQPVDYGTPSPTLVPASPVDNTYSSEGPPPSQNAKELGQASGNDMISQDPENTMVPGPKDIKMPAINPNSIYRQDQPKDIPDVTLTPISDNLSPQIAQVQQETALSDSMKKAEQFKQELAASAAAPKEDPTAQEDPWGIRVLKGISENLSAESFSEMLPSVGKDANGDIIGNPGSLLGGAYNGVAHAWNSMDGLAVWLNDTFDPKSSIATSVNSFVDAHILATKEDIQAGKADIPDTAQLGVPEPDHTLPALAKGATQFLVGFLPLMKAMKAASYTSLTARALAAVVASGSAAVTTAPQEGNLANLIESNPKLSNVVTEALAVNPSDPEWKARLKNGLTAMGLTAIAEPFVAAIGALKGFRQAKGATDGLPPLKVKPEDFTPAVQVTGDAGTDLYHPTVGETTADLTKRISTTPEAKVVEGFTDKAGAFHTPEEMTVVLKKAELDRAQTVLKGSTLRFAAKPGEGSVDTAAYEDFINGKGSMKKVLGTFSNTNMTMGQHVQQVIDRVGAMLFDKANPRPPVTKEMLSKFGEKVGSTPYELTVNHPEMVANPDKFEAATQMLNASQNSVVKLAEDLLNPKTVNATSEASLYTFLRAVNNHKAILTYLRTGKADAATAVMKKYPVPTGTVPEQVNKMAKALSDAGGASKVRAVAKLATKDPDSFAKALKGPGAGSLSEITMQWWYFNLLSNPLTQVRNIYGNTVNLLWQIPARNLAGELNAGFGFRNANPKGVAVNEGNELAYGMVTSLREAWRTAGRTWKTGKPSDAFGKMDEEIPNYLSSERYGWTGPAAKVMDGLGYVATLPGKSLLTVDEFFKTVAKIGQMRALAYRQASAKGLSGAEMNAEIERLMASPNEGMMADAAAFGREVTFTQDLGKWGTKFQNLINANVPVLNYPVMKLVIPFTRTTTNIFKEAVGNSPAAILSKTFRDDVSAGGARANLALAKFAMGSSAALLVGHEVLNDNITGYGPVDPGLRSTWLQTHRPYSFRPAGVFADLLGAETAPDGSRWLNYTTFQPLGTMVAVTASLTESLGPMRPDDYTKAFNQVAMATSQTVMSNTWGRSFSAFMDFIQGSDTKEKFLQQEIASMLIPAAVSSVAHMSDPVWRETNGMIDTLKSRIPGWFPGDIGSTSLNARHNIAGQPIYSQSLGPEIISPMYQFVPDGKPFFKWAWENQVPLKMPAKTQLGVDMSDDPANYEKFVMLAGNYAKIHGKGWYDRMNDIMEGNDKLSGAWAKGTDGPNGMRAYIARSLIQEYRKAAQLEMMKDPVWKQQWIQAGKQTEYNLLTAPGDMPQ